MHAPKQQQHRKTVNRGILPRQYLLINQQFTDHASHRLSRLLLSRYNCLNSSIALILPDSISLSLATVSRHPDGGLNTKNALSFELAHIHQRMITVFVSFHICAGLPFLSFWRRLGLFFHLLVGALEMIDFFFAYHFEKHCTADSVPGSARG